MSDHSELKQLAETLLACDRYTDFGTWAAALDAFEDASGPDVVLGLIADNDRLHAITGTSMGVGDGSGKLFVYGNYDSIKAAQAFVLNCSRLVVENDQLKAQGDALDALREALSAARPYVAFAFSEGMDGAHEAGIQLDEAMSKEARQ